MFIEFLIEHWTLAAAWMVLLFMILRHENSKSGQSISSQQLSNFVNNEGGVVVDVRESSEFKQGHIVNAINIPYRDLEKRLTELSEYKQKPVIVVCKIGQHSGAASKMLKANEFEDVYKLLGGLSDWTSNSMPLVKS